MDYFAAKHFYINKYLSKCKKILISKDLLEVFSPQKIMVNNKKTNKALIGLSDVNINGIKIILNKEIL